MGKRKLPPFAKGLKEGAGSLRGKGLIAEPSWGGGEPGHAGEPPGQGLGQVMKAKHQRWNGSSQKCSGVQKQKQETKVRNVASAGA